MLSVKNSGDGSDTSVLHMVFPNSELMPKDVSLTTAKSPGTAVYNENGIDWKVVIPHSFIVVDGYTPVQ